MSLSDDGTVVASGAYSTTVGGNVNVGHGSVYRYVSDTTSFLRWDDVTGEVIAGGDVEKSLQDVLNTGNTTNIKPTFDAGVQTDTIFTGGTFSVNSIGGVAHGLGVGVLHYNPATHLITYSTN